MTDKYTYLDIRIKNIDLDDESKYRFEKARAVFT